MKPASPSLFGNLAVGALLAGLALWLARLHAGPWWQAAPSTGRWLAAGGITLAWIAWCARVLWRERPGAVATGTGTGADPLLVAWASQTGFARELAERSVALLGEQGQPARMLPLERLDVATLGRARRVLFIASTTGEGDPPDHAIAFVRQVMERTLPLPGLHYAVLALGDRSYGDFCAFGHRLDAWLAAQGAQRLEECIDVDNGDGQALQRWRALLAGIGGGAAAADADPAWQQPHYAAWTLRARRALNPQGIGGVVFDLALVPADTGMPHWQAGDIAAILPRQDPQRVQAWLERHGLEGGAAVPGHGQAHTLRDLLQRSQLPDVPASRDPAILAAALQPLPPREYSIASIPAEGTLRLLLRRQLGPDGRPGLGSGWLCDHAPVGSTLDLRLRDNPNFHAPAPQQPLILIGNGTGVAGLRALLRARIEAGATRNWLLYGERHQASDDYYGDDFRRWQAEGGLERLDAVFSRDDGAHRYVQDALEAQSGLMVQWIQAGAAIYVCGSLHRMAPGVDGVIERALGREGKEALLMQGRYRRDVY